MKKKSFYLSILLVLCVLVSPLRANAASGQIFGASSEGYANNTFNEEYTTLNPRGVEIKNNGENTVIYLGLKVTDGTVNNYNATLTLSNSSFTYSRNRTRIASGWTGTINDNGDGTISINLTNSTGVTASSGANGNVLVATIGVDVNGASTTDTCTISLSTASTPEEPEENPTCTIDGDTYYCADGTVCTEEEYTAQCENPENPQTGSFLPYAVIIGGIGLAAVLYLVTKKNKIYHV